MPVPRPVPTRFTGAAVALLCASALLALASSTPALGAGRSLTAQEVSVRSPVAGCRSHGQWLLAGGRCRWKTVLRFALPDGAGPRATLALRARRAVRTGLDVRTAGAEGVAGVVVGAWPLTRRTRFGAIDVSAALDTLTERRLTLTLTSPGRSTIRLTRHGRRAPRLRLTSAPAGGDQPTGARPTPGAPIAPRPLPGVWRPTVGDPAAPPSVATPSPAGPGVNPPFLTRTEAIWVSASELASRPMSGTAWGRLKSAADGSLGTPAIADQNSDHDVNALAAALVFARSGQDAYRTKVATAISGAIGTEAGGRTLALGRNLASYVIAADLVGLGVLDPDLDARITAWLVAVRSANLTGRTLIDTHEERPNNWGTMAGASRIAVALYLNDQRDLDRAATVLRGYLGDRGAYAGFAWGELSWQADPGQPVGINPVGATRDGLDIGGALPDDMRRGCGFALPPCATGYPWEAMQGILVQAELLSRHGHGTYGWSDNAIWRAASFLSRIHALYGGWWATGDDAWQPWVLNHAYGTSLPASTGGAGKILGWTDWVYGG